METLCTEDGIEITDELVEQWAAPWERGEIPGTPGKIVVGRPRISTEDLATVTFKLPKSQVDALDETAKRAGETRSQFLRALVAEAISQS
ncbi:ribbon-helix-helix domain-containing protein [Eggerthella timonensis]|uniref:ribbon-helix-helix domain-containing protein n=1 Tax=Eggerthella timonensis TaxID=1871008 RepID=UPI000C76633F|nr:ribbon-helix-helix domain-containing protein [Eggerthella timonensis]